MNAGLENVPRAVKGVAGEPDQLVLGESAACVRDRAGRSVPARRRFGEPDRGRPVDELEGHLPLADASSRSSGASAACRNPCRAASGSPDRSGTCDCRRGLRYPWPLCDLMEPLKARQGRGTRPGQGIGGNMNAHVGRRGPNSRSQPRVGLFVTCLVDIIRPTRRFRRGQAARGRRLHGRRPGADLLRAAGL